MATGEKKDLFLMTQHADWILFKSLFSPGGAGIRAQIASGKRGELLHLLPCERDPRCPHSMSPSFSNSRFYLSNRFFSL